jgi:hypothetical protein
MVMMIALPLLFVSMARVATDPTELIQGTVGAALAGILMAMTGMGWPCGAACPARWWIEEAVMRVMIVGGGFIGGHLAGRLRAEGCMVTMAGRRGLDIRCDLASDDAAAWADRLRGYDALVNCAGVLAAGADYDGVHTRGSIALFDGAVRGRPRDPDFVAGRGGRLHRLSPQQTRGGRVSGDNGVGVGGCPAVTGGGARRGSTALFSALAALPLMPDIGGGMVQPIAIDDLVEAIWRLLQRPCPWR